MALQYNYVPPYSPSLFLLQQSGICVLNIQLDLPPSYGYLFNIAPPPARWPSTPMMWMDISPWLTLVAGQSFFSLLLYITLTWQYINNNNNHLFYIALLKSPEVALQSPVVIHTHSHPGGGKLHQ